MPPSFRLAVLALCLGFIVSSANAQVTSTFGVPTEDLSEIVGAPDGWDLTVIVTQPIAPDEDSEGQVEGVVETWNYYAADEREVTEFTVRPLLIKNEDEIYTVVGIGGVHEPQDPGLQEDVPFDLEEGTSSFSLEDDSVSYHIGFIGQRPDFGNNEAGGIIPFAADGGPGMFGMDTTPDTEFIVDEELISGHESAEGGRNYLFNFDITWGGEPIDPDPDGDGMRTVWEVKYGLDPEDPSDAEQDLDKDGLTNLREFELKLIPNNPDFDEDGVLDGVELGAILLNSGEEVPAPTLGEASPIGFARIGITSSDNEPDTTNIHVNGTYFGMTSAVTAAHLHGFAARGETAGPLFALTTSGGTEGTITGSGPLNDADFERFRAGETYINIHTADNGPGEIRGQVPAKSLSLDPKNPDSDDDLLEDGEELIAGTDPANADTDGDTFKDGTEINRGTDPLDPASKPETLEPLPEFGTEEWADGAGGPDSWDLTVVFTTPIAPPAELEGETSGTVEYLNYYHSESRTVGDHTVAPVLVKYIEDTDEYLVAGVGELHVADEAGPQERVPFVPVIGSNVIDLTEEGVTWHAAAYQGHPGAGNNANGAVIPFSTGEGAGMFGYDNQPEEELEEGQLLTSGHASEEGGRHYAFNFGIDWLGTGTPPFTITDVVHSGTEIKLTWNSRDGREYAVEFREDLSKDVWIELDDGVGSEGDSTSFTDADPTRAALPMGYYRIREN